MKSVLIIGVTGFIGRHLALQFAQHGWRVVGLGTRPPENSPQEDLARYYQLPLPSEKLRPIIRTEKPAIVINCAGRASVGLSVTDPVADFQSSIELVFYLLNYLRLEAPLCRFFMLSSGAVYGNAESLPIKETHQPSPISPYGFHKLICEQLCQEFFRVYKVPTAIARIFSSYGVGLRRQVLWDICKKAYTHPVLRMHGTGKESRDFLHVMDLARAIRLLAEKGSFEADIYNLASGRQTTIKELVDLTLSFISRKIEVEFDGLNPVGNPLKWEADISRISKIGFSPEIPLESGIKSYVNWCKLELVGE